MAGPRFVVAAGYGDPDPTQLFEKLCEVPRPEALKVLANINAAVCFGDETTRPSLIRRFVRGGDLARALAHQRDVPPEQFDIFTRITLLLMQKLVLATDATHAPSADPSVLGEIALRVNDFLVGSRFRHSDGGPPTDEDVMLESLATWDLSNERDLAYGQARASLMLRRYWPSDDGVVREHQRQISVSPDSAAFDGVTLGEYFAALFAVYSTIQSTPADLISGAKSTSVAASVADRTTFPSAVMRQVLERRSRTMAQFRQELTGGAAWELNNVAAAVTDDRFLADVRVFRQTPLVKLPNAAYCCLDAAFLAELLTTGVYWRVLETVPRAEGDAFQRLWGRLFELYLWDLLRYFYSGTTLGVDVNYSGGQIDALIDLHDSVVLLEFKGSLLRIDAKYERDSEAFRRDFRRKFVENEAGDGKGLTQLARAAMAIASGERLTKRQPSKIYPVLVAYEPAVEAFMVNRYANRLFLDQVAGAENTIRPLTLMSVQELEFALPYLTTGDIRWVDLLESRFRERDVRLTSVYQSIFDWPKQQQRRNEFLLHEFANAYDEFVRRFGFRAELALIRSGGWFSYAA